MSSFDSKKKKIYEGKNIIVDEEDKDVKVITFLCNGLQIIIDSKTWVSVKKELSEALR